MSIEDETWTDIVPREQKPVDKLELQLGIKIPTEPYPRPSGDDPIWDRYGVHRPDDYREVTGTEPVNFGGW